MEKIIGISIIVIIFMAVFAVVAKAYGFKKMLIMLGITIAGVVLISLACHLITI